MRKREITKNNTKFRVWMFNLSKLAHNEYGFSLEAATELQIGDNAEAWREYYNDGYTPKEAIDADLKNAV